MTQVSNESFTQLFDGQPLMAILRGFGAERGVSIARTAWDLGIDCVEVPIQSDRDIDALRAVVAAGTELGKSVGAGTITSLERVRQAAEAGAAVIGPDWFTALSGPFPRIKFVAAGGMDASNAKDFLKRGVKVVAVGSALADETQLPRLAAIIAAR